jgi:hypothetical protein
VHHLEALTDRTDRDPTTWRTDREPTTWRTTGDDQVDDRVNGGDQRAGQVGVVVDDRVDGSRDRRQQPGVDTDETVGGPVSVDLADHFHQTPQHREVHQLRMGGDRHRHDRVPGPDRG